MKKSFLRLLCMVLCMALVLGCMDVAALADKSGTLGELTWTLDQKGTLTISGTGIMPDFNLDSSDAWRSVKDDIYNVVIEEGVESIGYDAFYDCPNLRNVTMPNSIKSIGHFAFCDCLLLQGAKIPRGVTYIGECAFCRCMFLEKIEIPYGVTKIDNEAFFGCGNSTRPKYDVYIPDSVTYIGRSAFGRSYLSSVSLPRDVELGETAFDDDVQIQYREEPATQRTSILSGQKIDDFAFPAGGFKLPVPTEWEMPWFFSNGVIYGTSDYSSESYWYIKAMPVGNTGYDALCKNPDEAKTILMGMKTEDGAYDIEEKWMEADNYPVRILTFKVDSKNYGSLLYARNSIVLDMVLYSYDYPVTMEDMDKLVKFIGYDETEALFTAADTELTLSVIDDPGTVTAGENVLFSFAFANPEAVNKENGNDAVVWSVTKADTGEAVEGVSIDANGLLKVDKSLAEPVDLQVRVESELFDTSAAYNITAMPVVSAVTLDPAELFFYVGAEDLQTVKAVMEPATVPPVGLTWTAVKKDIVEINPVEDGTVSIKPLKAGKTDIAVKEPGGKNAKLTVNVVVPVESLELKVNGKPKAGGKVKIAATLAPKNAGNKAVQWSLDVGEDIATIDEKGQLTISKTAPSGTKITVTCTALGAPSPVVGTLVVEVL